MKIKEISTEQFAGIKDKEVFFEDGLNVIYGQNESGKSTLVNLLSRTLFQNLKIDGRSDKEFKEYFPADKKDGSAKGDSIDGKVIIEADNGTYTLSKEWGSSNRCTLTIPDGTKIKTENSIKEELQKILLYGEGVYTKMLLSSQRNTDAELQTILRDSGSFKATDKDNKKDLAKELSQAFSEDGGVSIDTIEQKIKEKVDAIAGKHWDDMRKAPVGNKRYETGLGEILTAYYALEGAKAKLKEIEDLEKGLDDANAEYEKAEKELKEAIEKRDDFDKHKNLLDTYNSNKKEAERLNDDIKKYNNVLAIWPKYEDDLCKAKTLQNEKGNRELLDQYVAAKEINDEIVKLKAKYEGKVCPAEDEIDKIKKAQQNIVDLKNKLCGMNIAAAIKMLGGHSVEITSALTGKPIELADGKANIAEAVKITIPGVMEMELAPADVDVSAVNSEITEQKGIVAAIFDKYSVDSLDSLEKLEKDIQEANEKIRREEHELSVCLGAKYTSYDELETAAKAITASVRSKEDIDNEIVALCGNNDISGFIGGRKASTDGYKTEYSTIKELESKIHVKSAELKNAKDAMSAVNDIPVEYKNISDTDKYLQGLKETEGIKRVAEKEASDEKVIARTKLESAESSGEDAREALEEKQRKFNETEELLEQWKHIQEVFFEKKKELQNNPIQDIVDNFTDYLRIISGERISPEFTEPSKLDMNIYSGANKLDYGKLSEGTKETVSLAFRLAVLDHLFPNGGGIIVLDDPFTDMDAERAAQSCELVKECAKRHQVIFLTCREDYNDMLEGNLIRI